MEMEVHLSMSLLQLMAEESPMPSSKEEIKRKNVIAKLKKILTTWVKKVAYDRRLPKNRCKAASATILPFGSYGLGVHNLDSDIDVLCVAPYFVTLAEDYFIVLYEMLGKRPDITEIYCIKDAKVPLMKFKFDGIWIDLPFAQLKVLSIPENVELFNPYFLRNIDEISWRSLSGVRANRSILRIVPNIELFQTLLRCVKLWAKRRGLYSHLYGYLGGIHLAVLVAFICQSNPNSGLSTIMPMFFKTFAFWPWPTPVLLYSQMMPSLTPTTSRFLMPIQWPCNPNDYCYSNITHSTFYRIRTEFLRGHALTKDIFWPDFSWRSLFEVYPHAKTHEQFLKICISAPEQDQLRDWAGWVKSRCRSLLIKLEEVLGFCDPNPSEYRDLDLDEPNIVLYWGFQPSSRDIIYIDFINEDYMKKIGNGFQGPGKMKLSIMKASQLPENAKCSSDGNKEPKAKWRMLRKIPLHVQDRRVDQAGILSSHADEEYTKDGSEPPLQKASTMH